MPRSPETSPFDPSFEGVAELEKISQAKEAKNKTEDEARDSRRDELREKGRQHYDELWESDRQHYKKILERSERHADELSETGHRLSQERLGRISEQELKDIQRREEIRDAEARKKIKDIEDPFGKDSEKYGHRKERRTIAEQFEDMQQTDFKRDVEKEKMGKEFWLKELKLAYDSKAEITKLEKQAEVAKTKAATEVNKTEVEQVQPVEAQREQHSVSQTSEKIESRTPEDFEREVATLKAKRDSMIAEATEKLGLSPETDVEELLSEIEAEEPITEESQEVEAKELPEEPAGELSPEQVPEQSPATHSVEQSPPAPDVE
ncbi:hypothetical protein ACFL1U_00400 [Patescibacteria group bacterium]